MSKGPNSVDVFRIATKGPGDVSGLMALIASGKIVPSTILAVLGKTEGNGGVNDFTREYALTALCEALSPHLKLPPRAVEDKIAFVMSGGTEGVLSPHLTVFARCLDEATASGGANSGKRLSIGIAHTRDFLPEELGRAAQMEETVKAVHLAMRDAGIDEPQDVHFVQIKCPLLTSERVEAALHRGRKTVTTSGYASMGYSRGASALGVAIALGELKADVREDQVLKDWNLFSSVASSSAGIELMHNVVIVMGNSAASASPFVIGHSVMRDSIDLAAVAGGAWQRRAQCRRRAERMAAWLTSSLKPKPLRMAVYAASATPCSTIPMWAPRDTLAPQLAGWSRDCQGPAPSMYPAAPNIRAPPAAAPSR